MNKYNYIQGDYQASKAINGETSWVNGANAIWLSSDNNWIIGELTTIGNNPEEGWILASNTFCGLTDGDNEWSYFVEGSWTKPSDPGNIHITYHHGKSFLRSIIKCCSSKRISTL